VPKTFFSQVRIQKITWNLNFYGKFFNRIEWKLKFLAVNFSDLSSDMKNHRINFSFKGNIKIIGYIYKKCIFLAKCVKLLFVCTKMFNEIENINLRFSAMAIPSLITLSAFENLVRFNTKVLMTILFNSKMQNDVITVRSVYLFVRDFLILY